MANRLWETSSFLNLKKKKKNLFFFLFFFFFFFFFLGGGGGGATVSEFFFTKNPNLKIKKMVVGGWGWSK